MNSRKTLSSDLLLDRIRLIEMVDHNTSTFNLHRRDWGITARWGSIPYVSTTSVLNWYPSLQRVCILPIDEDSIVIDQPLRDSPLFYSELNAESFLVSKKRRRIATSHKSK